MEHEQEYYYENGEMHEHSDRPDLVQRTPWWVISIVFHSAFLLMAAMWIVSNIKLKEEIEFVECVQRKYKAPEITKIRPLKKPTIPLKPVELEDDHTILGNIEPENALEITSLLDDDNDDKLQGEEDNLTHIDLKGKGLINFIGLLNSGPPGKKGFERRGRKGPSMTQYGGDGTIGPVEAALRWLKRHQAPDGSWSMENYSKQCKDAPPCEHKDIRCQSSGIDNGGWSEKNCATGFALLCYLGHGDTHRAGKFRQQVANGLSFLKTSQKDDGSFSNNNYAHAIAAMAAAEAYGMTLSHQVKEIAQKAVDVILARQNEYLGWNYQGPNPRNDTSVTGWQVMALKSAKSAGLDIGNSFEGVINHFNKVTPEVKGDSYPMLTGDVAYTYNSSSNALGSRNSRLTAIGLLSRVFAGEDTQGNMLRAHANMVLKKLPAESNNMDFYRWYYATLAMFQMGGNYWKEWNKAMKETFIATQQKGGCEDGSWDPNISYGTRGGRLFATAVGCLSLEVYYRYLPVSMR